MRLNQNMQSLNILKNYRSSVKNSGTALERISTGNKINSAKDNPVKLAQSENIRMQIRSLQMAEKNIQDGISMIQTADSSMGTITEALVRIKELVVQAGGVNVDEDKKIIQNEINQLKEFIDKTAETTEFNGLKLIDSDGVSDNQYPSYRDMQIGVNGNESIRIPVFNLTTEVIGAKNIDVSNIDKSLQYIDDAIRNVNNCRSKFGAIQQRFETSASNVGDTSLKLEKAMGNLKDSDVAFEMLEFSKNSILKETSTSIMAQTNNFPREILRILENVRK